MADYTLVTGKVLDEDPVGLDLNEAPVVLDDGSLFLAVPVDLVDGIGTRIRCQHLASADLSVLGEVAFTYDTISLHAFAVPGRQVMLVGVNQAGAVFSLVSWVIDCSGAAPSPGIPQSTEAIGGLKDFWDYYYYGPFSYRSANGFCVLGVGDSLIVWDDTGAVTWQGTVLAGDRCIGVWPDPSDATKGVFVSSGSAVGYQGFTIASDGTVTTTAFAPSEVAYDTVTGYAMLGASPFLGGPVYVGDYGNTSAPFTSYLMDSTSGATLVPVDTTPFTEMTVSTGTALGVSRMVGATVMYRATTGYDYVVWLAGIDFTATPTMEYLPLPNLSPSLWDLDSPWHPFIAADAMTGLVFVTVVTISDTDGIYRRYCWVIQGPIQGPTKPNLTGGPLGVDVYFSG